MIQRIKSDKIIVGDRLFDGYVYFENGVITAVTADELPFDAEYDRVGSYVAPGFIDMHTHGGAGHEFFSTAADMVAACNFHLSHGTTSICPTISAAPFETMCNAVTEVKKAIADETLLPNLIGLHMEGPFLNKDQCGAIDPNYIRDPKPEEYEEYLQYGKGAIARWTLAVEMDGAEQFAQRLREEGILPSVGHSNAEYCQVKEAYNKGVTHVTHLYSAMSTIVRKGGFRHSGVLESAFCIPDMTVEIIADGCHLPAELLEMVYRFKGPDKTALTCDSMRCAGQDVKESILGSLENGQKVLIEDDVAKQMDRSAFAGSIATDDRLIRVMTGKANVPLYDAVRMMTLTPAQIIGLGDRKGSIEEGKDADLIVFDEGINVSGVMVEGKGLLGKLA